MGDLILIAVGSALVSNVVLSQFLGICSFLGVSKKTETAVGMGRSRYLCYHTGLLGGRPFIPVHPSSAGL